MSAQVHLRNVCNSPAVAHHQLFDTIDVKSLSQRRGAYGVIPQRRHFVVVGQAAVDPDVVWAKFAALA